jgi:hypothetical protein
MAPFALALAAAAKIEAQRLIAPFDVLASGSALPGTVLMTAETVHADKGRTALAGLEVGGSSNGPGKLEAVR